VGTGIGWLPESVVTEDLANGTLCQIEGRSEVIELDVMAVRKPSTATPLAEKVWRQIVSNASDLAN
jgi:DNA-binding transcriptional LysR family regulator